jgi:hypothetical protein
MGTKYSTVSISNYNATPPSDDGSQVASNKVQWSTVKTKLTDPHNTAVTAINSNLVDMFDVGPTAKTASYTTVAADHNTVLEVTGTNTVTLLPASTAGAGYYLTVKNNDVGVTTVACSDLIDGAASVAVTAGGATTFMVNAAGTSYLSIAQMPGEDVDVTGFLTVTGAITGSGDLRLGDSDQIELGAGSGGDLRLYHDGTDSSIDSKTGVLNVRSDDFRVKQDVGSGSSTLIRAASGSSVWLYHDGSDRLQTTSAGVQVAGDITATGDIHIADSKIAYFGTGNDMDNQHRHTTGNRN